MSEPRLRATGVAGVDLTLTAGELVVVTGPSLSGKTTLVEALAGWARPGTGTVVWSDGDREPPGWAALTVVPQAFALLDELSVVENILLAGRFTGTASDPKQVDELLGRLGLDRLRHRGAREISVGERQRTMVARALVGAPQVVLADEPVAHQDQRHADVVLALRREAATAGCACLVTTRNPALATIADRVVPLGA